MDSTTTIHVVRQIDEFDMRRRANGPSSAWIVNNHAELNVLQESLELQFFKVLDASMCYNVLDYNK